jgi:hypothetical protein
MKKQGIPLTEDERASRFISISVKLQTTAFTEISNKPPARKKVVVQRLADFATFIAEDRKCAPGEIIWGSAEPPGSEHNITVLAAIKVLGEQAEKSNDIDGLTAVLLLQAMTLLIHAEQIASDERIKTEAMVRKHALGSLIDDLMKSTSA